jgi:carboxyl-terminal processing protease
MRRLKSFPQIFLLVAALLVGGCVTGPPRANLTFSTAERVAHNQRVFDRAWQLVNEKFFDAKFRGVDWAAVKTRYRPDAEKAEDDSHLYGVINAMLGELKESHNFALSPQRRWEYESKQRARIGIGLRRVEEHWVISEVLPNSPAEAAGVERGWLVESRNGKPLGETATFSTEAGEVVAYDFLDQHNQPRPLTLTARVVSTADRREARVLEDGVVYLRFDGFDRASLHWLSDQLKAHRNASGAIVDLRYNHGGAFYSLEFMLGEFFPHAVSVGTFVRRSGTESDKDSWQLFPARFAGKIVVLTDRSTASCAEIFSHVLRYHSRATIVGRPTAGAVVVSRFFSLPEGGMLQLAVEDFRGLDGQRLEGVGVKPDVTVPLTLADMRAGRDPDLAAAAARLHPTEFVARN